MEVFYLDQNAVSLLAFAPQESEWGTIKRMLESGYTSGKLVCPIPVETLVESAPCNLSQRLLIESLFQNISGSRRFLSFMEVIVDEILRLARPTEPEKFDLPFAGKWAEREDAAQQATQGHRESREAMSDRVKEFEKEQQDKPPRTPEERFESSSRERSGMLYRDLCAFLNLNLGIDPTYERPELMKALIDQGLTNGEASTIQAAIIDRRWERMPANYIDLKIGSRWDHDHQCGQRPKYYANDEIDRWRAAIALTHSDVFITDGYMADLCRRSGNISKTKVFSVKQTADVINCLRELQQENH